jgi:hypothetical protein
VWYISAAAVVVQLALCLFLLRREFRLRLNFASTDVTTHPALGSVRERTVLASDLGAE